jgi:hypothetical protein
VPILPDRGLRRLRLGDVAGEILAGTTEEVVIKDIRIQGYRDSRIKIHEGAENE